MGKALWLALLVAGCIKPDNVQCGDLTCPLQKVCAPSGGCVDPAQLTACAGLTDGNACKFSGGDGVCTAGVCEPQTCGDTEITGAEACDGANLGGATCLTYGFYAPEGLACASDCRADTSACVGRCGDGIKNGPELCDTIPGDDVFTCYEVGYDYGSVDCGSVCAPVYDNCERLSWQPHVHHADYPTRIASPHLGDTYIIDGGGYLHSTGGSDLAVAVPQECSYIEGLWASEDDVVFVAGSSAICRNDNGVWTVWQEGPLGSVNDVWGRSPSDVWTVGALGLLHFDGTQWTDTGAVIPTGVTLNRLQGNASGVLAAADQSGSSIGVYDGTSWTFATPKAGGYVVSMWVSPAGVVYAVVDTTVYRYANATWTPYALPQPYISDVWGIGENALYFNANDSVNYYDGTRWLTIDGPNNLSALAGGSDHLVATAIYDTFWDSRGFSWSVLAPQPNVRGLWAFGPADVIALTDSGIARYDGKTWSQPVDGSPQLNAVWAASSSFAVGVGYAGAIYHYDGTQWTNHTIAGGPELVGVWGESPTQVFATSIDWRVYGWDGATWTQVLTLPNAPMALWGSATAGTYVAARGDTKLYHHSPGAPLDVWEQITLPVDSPTAIWGDGTDVTVAVYDRRVFTYHNGTWTQLATRLAQPMASMIGAPGDVFGISGSDIVRWDGVTWDRVRLPASLVTAPTAVFSGNGVVVVGSASGVVTLIRPR